MKRKIQFRVWHTRVKEMFYPTVAGEFEGDFGDVRLCSDFDYKDVLQVEVDTPFIPMQFTGLKDKNGNMIYEGDILRLIDTNVSVFYNDATASFDQLHEGGDNENLYGNIEAGIPMEIIGNIYQHPHLFNSVLNDERSVATGDAQ